jgi:Tfp pilus assembly protein PilF
MKPVKKINQGIKTPLQDNKLKNTAQKKYLTLNPISAADYWWSALVFFITLLVYYKTMAPTVFFGDSGEFATVCSTLGIAHPTGYPLYTLIGYLFTKLIFWGDLAFRVNLMSGFFAALAVAGIFLIGRLFIQSKWLCLSMALLAAFSRTFWSQAVLAEVYSLAAFFLILILWVAFHLRPGNFSGLFPMLFLLMGLAMTHHITIAAFYPLIIWFIWRQHSPLLLNKKIWLNALVLFLLPMLAYLYIPLRSAANPANDWGNPESFNSFIYHITAGMYSDKLLEHGWDGFLYQIINFLQLLLKQYSWLLLVLPLGIFRLYSKFRPQFFLLLSLFTVNILYSCIYFIKDIDAYFIPAFLIIGLLLGFGLEYLHALLLNYLKNMRWSATLLVFLSSLLPLAMNFSVSDRSLNDLPRRYGENLLNSLAPDSIIFVEGDNEVFILGYLLHAEKKRPDVTLYSRNQNIYIYPVFQGKDRHAVNKKAISAFERETLKNESRPIYFSVEVDASYNLVQHGLLYKPQKNNVQETAMDVWPLYDTHGLDNPRLRTDFMTKAVVGRYYALKAAYHGQKQETVQANANIREALNAAGNDPSILTFIGTLFTKWKNYEQAHDFLSKALKLDPYDKNIYNELGMLAYFKNEKFTALEYFSKFIQAESGNYIGFLNRGLVYERIAEAEKEEKKKNYYFEMAMTDYQKARELAPENNSIQQNIADLGQKFLPLKNVSDDFLNKIKQNPQDAPLIYQFGVYLAKQGLMDQAIIRFNQALDIDPDYIPALTDLGGAYLKLEKINQAAAVFKKVLEKEPANIKARSGLDMIADREKQLHAQ